MRELLPDPSRDDGVDLSVLTHRNDRTPPQGRPWLMTNMVMSVDGAYALEGRSGGLGGPADRHVFQWLRASADVVLVAAGTARAERYRRPTLPDEMVVHRNRLGLPAVPQLVVVSRSANLPGDLPLLEGEDPAPLVAHPAAIPTPALPDGVTALPVQGRADQVDLLALLTALHRDHGADVVLCEGGPTLLGQLHRADLIDEFFLTMSPMLIAGNRTGLLGDTVATPRAHRLHRMLVDDDVVFCTYRRER